MTAPPSIYDMDTEVYTAFVAAFRRFYRIRITSDMSELLEKIEKIGGIETILGKNRKNRRNRNNFGVGSGISRPDIQFLE